MNDTVTIQDQLNWEQEMIYRGVRRYRDQQSAAITGGRAADTSAGSRLMKSYLLQVSDYIQEYLDGKLEHRRRHKYAKLLATVNTDVVAMFALKQLLSTVLVPDNVGNGLALQAHCLGIGMKLEDELRFSKFQTEHKEYYDTIARKFAQRKTVSYRHKHNSLGHSATHMGVQWTAWTVSDKIHVGALVVGLVVEACDLFEVVSVRNKRNGSRHQKFVVPTDECKDWIMKHDAFSEVSNPDRMPCIVPPADWASPFDGGYLSPMLRHMSPLVKKVREDSTGARANVVNKAIMPKVLSAVNAAQATPWRLNTAVLDVMKYVWTHNLGIGMPNSSPYEMPKAPVGPEEKPSEWEDGDPRKAAFIDWKSTMSAMYTLEQERIAKNMAIIRTLRMANEMKDKDKFYYVYQLDFRGRMYCATTGLSPQGTDHSKALLTFGRSETLGERGWYWLRVHGANKYGYDKTSYDDRVKWIDERRPIWLAIASDPIGQREHWQDADKPWQFLAWVFEYAAAYEFGTDYRSSLPVALDGSCNGLQHFSAMLRDEVGGRAVNLTPSEVPADIYQNVADVTTQRVIHKTTENVPGTDGAHNWLSLLKHLEIAGLPRKLTKKPVMTLPYGSTPQACTQSIFDWTQENAPDFFPKNEKFMHAVYLSPLLWASIGDIVISARAAMDWIQKCTQLLSKQNVPLHYVSPLGFPVYQAQHHIKTKMIDTQIGGRLQLRIGTETTKLDVRKQKQGSSPNLVHHADATHLMMTINAGVAQDIDCFAMIHDDFGVHAKYVDAWHKIIRDTFIELHTEHDILGNFKKAHEEAAGITLPDIPPHGSLDLANVAESRYFFG